MKRLLSAAAICSLALLGCATPTPKEGTMATRENPVVSIVNGREIRVTPDPLQFPNDRRPVTITWTLDASASAFQFKNEQGVHVEKEVRKDKTEVAPDPEELKCKVVAGGRQFKCVNRNSRAGTYKYSIRLMGPGGELFLDPLIVNAE